jgi:FkbM family methyltransferase
MNSYFRNCTDFILKHRTTYILFYPAIIVGRRVLKTKRREVFYHSLFDMVEAGSLVVKIPTFQGSFEMDFRSHLLERVLMEKTFEPDIVELVKQHLDPQKDVIDVGANVGFYTVLFSKILNEDNKVLAIEPTPLVLGYLRRNIERNGCTKSVLIFEGIATNSKGDYRLNTIVGMEEFSSIGKIVHSYVAEKKSVPLAVKGDTIDNLVYNLGLRPGFIKVDVEGAEYWVLTGAVSTIKEYRPIIVFELSENLLASCGTTPQMVLDFLQQYNYIFVRTSDGFMAIPEVK